MMAEENDGNCMGNLNKNEEDEKDALGNSNMFNQRSVAKMPTEPHAPYYNMNHKRRGIAMVFNHEHFDIGGLSKRSGTNKDCECLIDRLKMLGFDVQVFHDLEYSEVYSRVTAAAAIDHTDNDCFIMVILSHGELGILYAKDSPYKPENLWMPFTADKCPSLAGKPKLFFIQACQGDRLDPGITMRSRTETDGHPPSSYRIPTHADFLVVYSTIPGYYSWRNTTKGSWFIQALCTELEESSENYDLLTLLTFVNRRVAVDYESNVPTDAKMHSQKQIPCITSMLIRLLKFNRKGVIRLESDGQETKTKEKSKNNISNIFSGRGKTNSYRINY